MAVLTKGQRNRLEFASPLSRSIHGGTLLPDALTLQYGGRIATSHVRIATNPTNGDTITIAAGGVSKDGVFHPGKSAIYEIRTDTNWTAGYVQVTRGANAAATATALAAAIAANQGSVVTAVAHATDTTVVDIAHRFAGGTLTLTPSAAARTVCQNNDDPIAKDNWIAFSNVRTVTAEDVTRTRVRIDTGYSALLDALVITIVTSSTDSTWKIWDGTPVVTGGVIELPKGTTNVLAAGNIITVLGFGQP